MNYYIAYGSNLNMAQMAQRCPHAVPVGKGHLVDYKLEFRYHATIVPCKGESVPVVVWAVSDTDMYNLDRYEGFPRYYRRAIVKVGMFSLTTNLATTKDEPAEVEGIVYIMNGGRLSEPCEQYFDIILEGYRRFGLSKKKLDTALYESMEV